MLVFDPGTRANREHIRDDKDWGIEGELQGINSGCSVTNPSGGTDAKSELGKGDPHQQQSTVA